MANQALSAREQYCLDLLKKAELIAFNIWHSPKITSAGIELLKDMYQASLDKSPLAPTPELMSTIPPGLKDIFMATEEKALDAYVKIGVLDANRRSITDYGIRFFVGMVEKAFQAGFTGVTVASITVSAEEIAEMGAEKVFEKFEPSKTTFRKDLVSAILKSL
jgi:hypothetical protein